MTTQTVSAGCEELCQALDAAVRGAGSTADTTRRVESTLRRHQQEHRIHLPAALTAPCPDGYARRLVHRSADLGYTVVAMVWNPGQGTALHDHCGMWCVECVIDGEMEVVQYELMEEREGLYRFESRATIHAGVGSAGSLIPPFEYHTMRNHLDRASITVHVYQGELQRCCVFHPQQDGWYNHSRRELGYSA